MRPLPDWLRRQRAQWLVNLGCIAVVDAVSQATATLCASTAPDFPIYVLPESFATGHPLVVSRRLEPTFDVIAETVRYRGTHGMIKRFLRHDLDPTRATTLGNAMCLAINLCWNYHHWLLEILPNAVLAEAAGFRGIYLIPPYRYASQSLALLGIDAKRLVVHQRDELWRIKQLHVAAPIDGETNMRQPAALAHLRDKLRDAAPTSTSRRRRLYVSRNRPGAQRRVVNEPELKSLLDRFGFEEFFAEDHTVAEQLAAFASAEAAIGVEGAGFASALVMPRDALVMTLFSPVRFDAAGTVVLARLNRLRYHTIFAHVPADGGYSHADNVVANLELIETTLERELS